MSASPITHTDFQSFFAIREADGHRARPCTSFVDHRVAACGVAIF